MSIDIKKIPIDKLEKDLHESLYDIYWCKMALAHGINNYSGGSVLDRLNDSEGFVKVITKELIRRKGE